MSKHTGAIWTEVDKALYWARCLCQWESHKYLSVSGAQQELGEHIANPAGVE